MDIPSKIVNASSSVIPMVRGMATGKTENRAAMKKVKAAVNSRRCAANFRTRFSEDLLKLVLLPGSVSTRILLFWLLEVTGVTLLMEFVSSSSHFSNPARSFSSLEEWLLLLLLLLL